MTRAELDWFVVLADGTTVRSRLAADVDATRPSTARFTIFDESAAVAGLPAGPATLDVRGFRALHVLALAERTLRLVESRVGELDWRRYSRLGILPHAAATGAPTGAVGALGEYLATASSGRVRLFESPTTTAARSHDIAVHEITHALLHNHKNWYAPSVGWPGALETRAVSEAVGDAVSMLSAARIKAVRATIPGPQALDTSNVLSQFGEPALGTLLRDAATPVVLDRARLVSTAPEDAYQVALALSSGIHDGLRRTARAYATTASWPDALERAVRDVATAVLCAVAASPMDRVGVDAFATAIAHASPPSARASIEAALRGVGLDTGAARRLDALPALDRLAQGDVDTSLVDALATELGGTVAWHRWRAIPGRGRNTGTLGTTLEFRCVNDAGTGSLLVDAAGAGATLVASRPGPA